MVNRIITVEILVLCSRPNIEEDGLIQLWQTRSSFIFQRLLYIKSQNEEHEPNEA
jgi:hypothetical protein